MTLTDRLNSFLVGALALQDACTRRAKEDIALWGAIAMEDDDAIRAILPGFVGVNDVRRALIRQARSDLGYHEV